MGSQPLQPYCFFLSVFFLVYPTHSHAEASHIPALVGHQGRMPPYPICILKLFVPKIFNILAFTDITMVRRCEWMVGIGSHLSSVIWKCQGTGITYVLAPRAWLWVGLGCQHQWLFRGWGGGGRVYSVMIFSPGLERLLTSSLGPRRRCRAWCFGLAVQRCLKGRVCHRQFLWFLAILPCFWVWVLFWLSYHFLFPRFSFFFLVFVTSIVVSGWRLWYVTVLSVCCDSVPLFIIKSVRAWGSGSGCRHPDVMCQSHVTYSTLCRGCSPVPVSCVSCQKGASKHFIVADLSFM